VCCCLICSTFCASGFFAAAGLTGAVDGLACATDGAALAAAGGALAVAVAGVAAGFVAAGAIADLVAAGVVTGAVFAVGAGAFLSLLLSVDCSFLVAGVVPVAGGSAEVFVSGARDGAGFGAFLFGFGATGSSFVAGSFTAGSFTAGSFTTGSFTAGVSVFGACGARGFTSVGGFLSGAFLLGDSSGIGCWAITAPASASEATISKLVNFFMLILFWSLKAAIYSTPGVFTCLQRRSP
jgi:hypothetical protein